MTFYIDASLPVAVARALSLVRGDITYPGWPGCPVTSVGERDAVWLPIAGAHEWVVIMRDKRIRTRPGERRLLLEHGIRAFCLTTSGNASKWAVLQLLVSRWADMEGVLAVKPAPFIYAVTASGGVRELAVFG